MFGWIRGPRGLAAAKRLVAKGRSLEERGRLDDACVQYRAAIDAAPGHAAAHLNLGVALEAQGKAAEAGAAYEAALALDPADPYASFNLGKLRHAQGAQQTALELLSQALRIKTDFPEAEVVRASVQETLGDATAALASLEAALRLRPGYGGALRNRGLLLARLGRWRDAEEALRQATASDPQDADALYWRGNALVNLSRPADAEACFRQALRVRPDFAEAHCNLGSTLGDLGRRDEAIASLQRAAALKPDLADAHVGLGNQQVAARQFEAAAASYRRALGLEPRLLQAQINLGNVLADLGQPEAAARCFEAALSLDPESGEARWSLAMSRIPALRDAPEDLARSRTAFAAELADLDRWFDVARAARGHRVVGVQQPFWLAYQDESNVELLRRYGSLCARLMEPWQRTRAAAPIGARPPGKLRVGVVSPYLRHHSVWNAIVKGWFQQLDRERFELSAFCLGTEQDAETDYARSRAARFEIGARPFEQWADCIREIRPDVLLYPEIGMDPVSVKLAALRLAPLQAVAWGHPETTGLPTVDCYLSAQGMEPEGAAANYSEELLLLPNLGCYVQVPAGPAPAALDDLGVDLPGPLFICPGTPFKYAPEHDRVFPRIARELGQCRFVFFTHWTKALSEKLRGRLERAFAREGLEFARHVTFLPWLTRPAFLGLMRRADAFLDTIGFSGFNTAQQAVESGLPVVALRGRFLRGRLASGILERMGLPELVAADEDGYVGLAVKLARDPVWRESLRRRMAENRHLLFEDVAPIRALEAFLLARAG